MQIVHMNTAQDYVWCKIYIQFESIFKTFVSLFKTCGMQKDDKIIFCFGDVSAQGDVQKSVTNGWCKESSTANPRTVFSGYS